MKILIFMSISSRTLKISTFYDTSFANRFGDEAKAAIKEIMTHTQTLVNKDTAGRVNLQVDNVLPLQDATLDPSQEDSLLALKSLLRVPAYKGECFTFQYFGYQTFFKLRQQFESIFHRYE